ncbi:MAG TPA: pseudouridine-5'-phosphate glycosidase [Blastocatellia bacterium]|nr:pseudouridine-5'-phosphate glycosidase [Blastocatellia bacterium]HMX24939.1 pseudouridine-5'-phosphate glycosidase [Blastocatellia bacterium]HMZ16847.1 pseudouridine-5'-phosphate glycosidase [Blastocatellia bacterium]HNG29153.1 pseudouridine-5'-phosphate glycosidase [Blastocatellia bacterium]
MFSLSPVIAQSLQQGRAVVALESTVIAHGLPAPHNLETARACETAVREAGAEPATIGILAGQPTIGLTPDEVQSIADRDDVLKVNFSNLGACLAQSRWGATTVASTLHFAQMAGIKVFATGGIGGVHRGAGESFDISADLNALARYPLVTVCAGAKAILDLPKTLEVLETLGVPVVGYQTDELPAFYSRSSGIPLDLRADSPENVAAIAAKHWQLGFSTGVLVVAPVPAEAEVPAAEIRQEIDDALTAAAAAGISGKAVTPFLLSRIAARTAGRALRANIALLQNNAGIAGQIARALQ